MTPLTPSAEMATMLLRLVRLYEFVILIRFLVTWLPIDRGAGWYRLLLGLTEPLFTAVRRLVPPVGPFDVSPIAALLLLSIVEELIKMVFTV